MVLFQDSLRHFSCDSAVKEGFYECNSYKEEYEQTRHFISNNISLRIALQLDEKLKRLWTTSLVILWLLEEKI